MERIIPAEKGHFIIFRLLLFSFLAAEVFGASGNGLGFWNWIGEWQGEREAPLIFCVHENYQRYDQGMSRAHPCLTFLSTDFKIGVLDPIRPCLHIQ